ncbi:MAG: PorT family protein [Bacteroides sp.]|nr:PorT family protein [Bacteroides sp.]
MRKLFTTFVAALLCVASLSAQNFWNNDNYMGVRLGLNMSSVGGVNQDKSMLAGLNVGVVYGISLNSDMPIYFEPGLFISSKGVKYDASHDAEEIKSRLTYLEIPFVFKYKWDELGNDISIQPFLGGFASIGLCGKTKDFEAREKYNSFNSNAYRRFDAGLRLGCGVAYQNLYLDLSYDLGLANIASNKFGVDRVEYDDFDGSIRTRCLTISIGLDF